MNRYVLLVLTLAITPVAAWHSIYLETDTELLLQAISAVDDAPTAGPRLNPAILNHRAAEGRFSSGILYEQDKEISVINSKTGYVSYADSMSAGGAYSFGFSYTPPLLGDKFGAYSVSGGMTLFDKFDAGLRLKNIDHFYNLDAGILTELKRGRVTSTTGLHLRNVLWNYSEPGRPRTQSSGMVITDGSLMPFTIALANRTDVELLTGVACNAVVGYMHQYVCFDMDDELLAQLGTPDNHIDPEHANGFDAGLGISLFGIVEAGLSMPLLYDRTLVFRNETILYSYSVELSTDMLAAGKNSPVTLSAAYRANNGGYAVAAELIYR